MFEHSLRPLSRLLEGMSGLMDTRTCLKCNHENIAPTMAQLESCPACGAIYSRVEQLAAEGKLRKPPQRLAPPVLLPPSGNSGREARNREASKAVGTTFWLWLIIAALALYSFSVRERPELNREPVVDPKPDSRAAICSAMLAAGATACDASGLDRRVDVTIKMPPSEALAMCIGSAAVIRRNIPDLPQGWELRFFLPGRDEPIACFIR